MKKNSNSSLNKKEWDYTDQAKYYVYRPNYAPKAIAALCQYVDAKSKKDYLVADVGAGTGNLTKLLLKHKLNIIAIEPNAAMRQLGQQEVISNLVTWQVGTGEETGLNSESIDWFTMGSSFNTTDRMVTLQEAHRVLKPEGYFTCMWNNRDVTDDQDQNKIETVIRAVVPDYNPGVRREGQADFILFSRLFNDVHYTEESQTISRSFADYIKAWKSVKNVYWDFETKKGLATFNTIVKKMEQQFGKDYIFEMKYVTRIWTAKKI